jgi:hypothetical protein
VIQGLEHGDAAVVPLRIGKAYADFRGSIEDLQGLFSAGTSTSNCSSVLSASSLGSQPLGGYSSALQGRVLRTH